MKDKETNEGIKAIVRLIIFATILILSYKILVLWIEQKMAFTIIGGILVLILFIDLATFKND